MRGATELVPGTGLEPASLAAADFRHTAPFDASAHRAVRALDYAFTLAPRALGAPRLVSTPVTPVARAALARRCLGSPRGFAEFEGFPPGAFAARCSSCCKSAMFTCFITPAGSCGF